jgi:hypothetical protein
MLASVVVMLVAAFVLSPVQTDSSDVAATIEAPTNESMLAGPLSSIAHIAATSARTSQARIFGGVLFVSLRDLVAARQQPAPTALARADRPASVLDFVPLRC